MDMSCQTFASDLPSAFSKYTVSAADHFISKVIFPLVSYKINLPFFLDRSPDVESAQRKWEAKELAKSMLRRIHNLRTWFKKMMLENFEMINSLIYMVSICPL